MLLFKYKSERPTTRLIWQRLRLLLIVYVFAASCQKSVFALLCSCLLPICWPIGMLKTTYNRCSIQAAFCCLANEKQASLGPLRPSRAWVPLRLSVKFDRRRKWCIGTLLWLLGQHDDHPLYEHCQWCELGKCLVSADEDIAILGAMLSFLRCLAAVTRLFSSSPHLVILCPCAHWLMGGLL